MLVGEQDNFQSKTGPAGLFYLPCDLWATCSPHRDSILSPSNGAEHILEVTLWL